MFETKKQLRKECENAETRAVTYFRKLNEIEQYWNEQIEHMKCTMKQ